MYITAINLHISLRKCIECICGMQITLLLFILFIDINRPIFSFHLNIEHNIESIGVKNNKAYFASVSRNKRAAK